MRLGHSFFAKASFFKPQQRHRFYPTKLPQDGQGKKQWDLWAWTFLPNTAHVTLSPETYPPRYILPVWVLPLFPVLITQLF